MSARNSINLKAFREQALRTLKDCRTASSPDEVHAEFYVALGLISAGFSLEAICLSESDRLRDLALNASKYRADELSAMARAARRAKARGTTA